jgi:hypothetical protein
MMSAQSYGGRVSEVHVSVGLLYANLVIAVHMVGKWVRLTHPADEVKDVAMASAVILFIF